MAQPTYLVVEDRVDVYSREEVTVHVRTPLFYGTQAQCEAFIAAQRDYAPEFQQYDGKLSVIHSDDWQVNLREADSEGERVDGDEND